MRRAWVVLGGVLGSVLVFGGVTLGSQPAVDRARLEVNPRGVDSSQLRATWTIRCARRQCPTQYRVTWRANGAVVQQQTVRLPLAARRVANPRVGDSTRWQVEVVGLRDTTTLNTITQQVWVRPSLQAIRAAQVAAADAAVLDSFPRGTWVLRPAVEPESRKPHVLPIHRGPFQLCLLARNRYTGRVGIMVDRAISEQAAARLDVACAKAAEQYERERNG